jgi:hypothetical protein
LFKKAKFVDSISLAQIWNCCNIRIPLTRGSILELRKEKADLLAIMSSSNLEPTKLDIIV